MLSHKILELRVSADDHLCLQAVCGIGDPWPLDASRPVSGRRNRTVGSIDIPEHDPMLTSMIGRLRPSAAGSPWFRSDFMQGQAGAPCSARYDAIPCNAVHMGSICEHSSVRASARDVYLTRSLIAAVGIVINTAGFDLSRSRLRAAAWQASSTLSQNDLGGVRKRSEQLGSRVPGWRDGVKPSAINRPASEKSVGEGISIC